MCFNVFVFTYSTKLIELKLASILLQTRMHILIQRNESILVLIRRNEESWDVLLFQSFELDAHLRCIYEAILIQVKRNKVIFVLLLFLGDRLHECDQKG